MRASPHRVRRDTLSADGRWSGAVVLYQIPSLDPELTVTVGWDPARGGYVARVDGNGHGDRAPAWFGTGDGRLRTVCDLQRAIRQYAVIRPEVRAALEADQVPAPAQAGPRNGHPAAPPRRDGRPLRALLLTLLALLAIALAVALLQAVWPGS
jgi:hypothetical protein